MSNDTQDNTVTTKAVKPERKKPSEAERKHAAVELAKAEFAAFMRMWDVDTDREFMDADTKQGFDELERKVCREILRGRFRVLEDENTLEFDLVPGSMASLETVVFKKPKFNVMMQLDQYKEGQNMKKMQAFAGAVTGLPPKTFANMEIADGNFCVEVASVFFSR